MASPTLPSPLRVLTGITTSGTPHLGNYVGSIRHSVRQSVAPGVETFFFLADYHALIKVSDPALVQRSTLEIAASWLACGLDPEHSVFWRQSDVPEVTELTWILGTLTPIPMLENCHSYKDKTARGMTPNAGLFTYPVLMAADILIYDSDIVPVGRDQKQHVEVTRDIANIFNRLYKANLFVVPEPSILPTVATIPGLDGQKMSKSYGNTIELFEEEKALRKKVMGITTDSTPVEQPKDPEKSSILGLYRLVADSGAIAQMEEDFRIGGVGYGDFKAAVADGVVELLAPVRERYEELRPDEAALEATLAAGAEKARAIASVTVADVRERMGFG
jgi:tryptophanyl-tRNA synthetase